MPLFRHGGELRRLTALRRLLGIELIALKEFHGKLDCIGSRRASNQMIP
jgi:hypothetical protein